MINLKIVLHAHKFFYDIVNFCAILHTVKKERVVVYAEAFVDEFAQAMEFVETFK